MKAYIAVDPLNIDEYSTTEKLFRFNKWLDLKLFETVEEIKALDERNGVVSAVIELDLNVVRAFCL